VAYTLAFVGPLSVAIAGSRRRVDLVWVVLAAAGILLLADSGSGDVAPLGVALGLLAGVAWAAHILLAVRTGRVFTGPSGLTLAMCVALIVVMPVAGATAGGEIVDSHILALGAAVGVLSTAIPWSLELEALRRMPARVFGILMSIQPAAAALAGLAILGERLEPRAATAIALVTVASAGALRRTDPSTPAEP
jgi:inner membrane transporter RhtA